MPSPTEYIALGDSMSIDLYPALDAGEIEVSVALEWDSRAGQVAPLGAASLFHRNVDDRYPEFESRDLVSRYGDIAFANLSEDGATIGDVFGSQMLEITESDESTLITLTIGGNDLLSAFEARPDPRRLAAVVRDVAEAYEMLVESLERTRPNAALILTTVYDPSDDTRTIPGLFEGAGKLPLEALHDLNARIKRVATHARRAAVADAYTHFQGHGVTAPEAERWYWKRNLIEPSATGASEIRRLWLDALLSLDED
ncbi:MAG TPA: GDSL-type esterase/lipase family protein [Gemmatimonadaceae bacterium]|nr:GDSL-type esterase/lipase family protein [Gemmatimonadaceae bacterium]